MTKFKLSAAALAVGVMALGTPALAQQTVTPKSGPDINQPKVVPNADRRLPSTSGSGMNRDNTDIKGGGGSGNSSGSSGGTGAAGGTGGGAAGGTGGGAGGAGGSSGQ